MNIIKKIQVGGVDYDIQAKELTNVTYVELKEMRDNDGLIAGHLYRITDHVTTVVLDLLKSSANHPFDIIVTAISSSELSEDAKAILHEGDTYFAKCDLSAWELKYCLDNDTNRFAWVDSENGKGVIYYMKDENGNEAPYDFKNILFNFSGLYYTFHTESLNGDMSLYGNMCSNNSIKELIDENGVRQLPRNILVSANDNDVFMNNIFNSGVRNCSLRTTGIGSSSTLKFDVVNYEFLNGLTDKTYTVNLTASGKAPAWDKKYVSIRSELTPGGAARYGITSLLDSLISIKSEINNKQAKLVSGTSIKTINGESLLGSGDIQIQTEILVTHSELVTLRNENKLIPGVYYRITDYEFTTIQTNTKSAGHPFDVIVLATAENQLSELARAIQHEEDTYFDGNDLGAWELWYDLDNDIDKYEWADAENGKGVIYRMIDDKRNDCPYDFKNALFYNEKLTASTTTDKYYYTFSYFVNGVLYDGTVEKQVTSCYGNSMGIYLKSNNKKSLNLNVFRNTTFGNYCYYNIFGSNCYSNTFGNSCSSNKFGDNCYSNTFGDYCDSNTFGNSCDSNTFGYSSIYNIFGNSCSSNKFGDNCYSNTFGDYCDSNTFGNSCSSNKFGDNIFGRILNLNSENTSITENNEYFDDGSRQLVPIKHPDLSTQPSILPYKFMGQYVYEQLIPVSLTLSSANNTFRLDILAVDKPIFLDAFAIGKQVCSPSKVQINSSEIIFSPYSLVLDEIKTIEYYKVIYTTMPEEEDYYGYNNY